MSFDSILNVQTFKDKIDNEHALVFCFGTRTSELYTSTLSHIKTFSNGYPSVKVYAVDVNKGEAGDIAAELGITEMPTVILYENKLKIGEAIRPQASDVKTLLEKLRKEV